MHVSRVKSEAAFAVEVAEELVLVIGDEQAREAKQVLRVVNRFVPSNDLFVAAVLPQEVLQNVRSPNDVGFNYVGIWSDYLGARLSEIPSAPEIIESVFFLEGFSRVTDFALVR